MKKLDLIENNKKIITIVLIALMLFVRCIFGVYSIGTVVVAVGINAIAFLMCMYFFSQDWKKAREIIISVPTVWAFCFFMLEFINHLIGRGYFFSTRTTLLTIGTAVLILWMLWLNQGDTLDIVTYDAEILIMATFLFTLYYDRSAWRYWLQGVAVRFGSIPNGTVIDTANLYLVMLIPIAFRMLFEKKFKRYMPITVLTLGLIAVAGSKGPVFAISLVVVFLLLFNTKSKKELIRNIIILLVLAYIAKIVLIRVPLLFGLIGNRIVELVFNFSNTDYDLTTSTGQRMAALHEALAHWSENPIFGHGFYNFNQHEYSYVEAHWTDAGKVYESMQIHMNFMELIFSFGIFGLVLYYWFPGLLVYWTIRCKDKNTRLLTASYLLAFLVVDSGLDMYYKYITPYLTYFIVYCLLKEKHEE